MLVAWKYCIKVVEVILENKIFGYQKIQRQDYLTDMSYKLVSQ